MKRFFTLLLPLALFGCDPGGYWQPAPPDSKIDSLQAILVAQEICRPDIEKLEGRQREEYFDYQHRYGWSAVLENGKWSAGVRTTAGVSKCYFVGADIDAKTGSRSSCLQCVTVG